MRLRRRRRCLLAAVRAPPLQMKLKQCQDLEQLQQHNMEMLEKSLEEA